ncbi:MAG: ribosome recycling factor [Bacteroidales bacterium]|nr:ribosome recycling factor [Bacteroidales bacterium]
MKTSVIKLLDGAQNKMSGYVALLNYRYSNLSVNAQPEALLCVFVDIDGVQHPIEKVAKGRNPDDRQDQFEIYPNSLDLLKPVVKAIHNMHPEYKIEIKDIEEGEEEKYILVTMPPVDDARYKFLTEAVGVLADVCNGQLEAVFNKTVAEIGITLAGASEDEIKEAKDMLQDVHDKADKLAKQIRGDKEKEIEDAHDAYKAKQEEKKAEMEKKMQEAKAGTEMKMSAPGDE